MRFTLLGTFDLGCALAFDDGSMLQPLGSSGVSSTRRRGPTVNEFEPPAPSWPDNDHDLSAPAYGTVVDLSPLPVERLWTERA